MSEAFDGLDTFCHAYAMDRGASPDAAENCVFMLKPADWAALDVAWATGTAGWREGCAYILGLGPPRECLRFLSRALMDLDLGVASQAAISYAGLVLEHGRVASVAEATRDRLVQVVAGTGSAHMEEVAQLLAALEQPPRAR